MLKKTKLHAYKFLSKTRNNCEKTENCQDMALIPKKRQMDLWESSRPAISTQKVPNLPGIHSEILCQNKTTKQTNKKPLTIPVNKPETKYS